MRKPCPLNLIKAPKPAAGKHTDHEETCYIDPHDVIYYTRTQECVHNCLNGMKFSVKPPSVMHSCCCCRCCIISSSLSVSDYKVLKFKRTLLNHIFPCSWPAEIPGLFTWLLCCCLPLCWLSCSFLNIFPFPALISSHNDHNMFLF